MPEPRPSRCILHLVLADTSLEDSLLFALSELDADCRIYSDGNSFLSQLHEESGWQADVVLVRQDLPDMDGLELFEQAGLADRGEGPFLALLEDGRSRSWNGRPAEAELLARGIHVLALRDGGENALARTLATAARLGGARGRKGGNGLNIPLAVLERDLEIRSHHAMELASALARLQGRQGLRSLLPAVLRVMATDIIVLDREGQVVDIHAAMGDTSGMESYQRPNELFPLPDTGEPDSPKGFDFLSAMAGAAESYGLDPEDGAEEDVDRHETERPWPNIGRSGEERRLIAARISDGAADVLSGEGGSFTMEYPAPLGDRSHVWRQLRIAPMFSEEGEAVGAVVAVVDMSELKQAQEGLRSQRNLFRSILSSMVDSIVLKDSSLRYLAVNPSYAKLLGQSESELLKTRDEKWFAPSTAELLREADESVLASGSSHFLDVSVSVMGVMRWMHVAKTVVSDEYGRPMGLICSMRDITTRREMEKELRKARNHAEQATQAKSAFLATMSHEIRTPLSGIIGLAEEVLCGELDEEQRARMDMLKQSANHLLALLGDLLDYSRIEAGKLSIRMQTFRLAEVVGLVDKTFAPVASTKGLVLDVLMDGDLSTDYRGDQARIRQVLFNLVSNAVKYTDQGSVTLHVRRDREDRDPHDPYDVVTFEVSDTGMGISPADQENLFRDYARTDAAREGGYAGTGLGLSISRQLAEMMGGSISLTSAEGQGSTFWFRLPLEPQLECLDTEAEAGGASISVPLHLTALLVEDNKVNRLLARSMLERLGHKALEAENGQEALDMLAREHADLVLLDIRMPVMDGLETISRIRSDRSGLFDPDIPVAALTAQAMPGDGERFLAAGMDAYLAKPLDMEDLQTIIMQLCCKGEHGTSDTSGTQTLESPVEWKNIMTNILDSDVTLKRLHGDREFLKILYAAFLEDLDEREAGLGQAVSQRDYEDAMSRAHALKGASRTIDAVRVSQLCQELERACEQKDEATMDEIVDSLGKELAKVREAMESFQTR